MSKKYIKIIIVEEDKNFTVGFLDVTTFDSNSVEHILNLPRITDRDDIDDFIYEIGYDLRMSCYGPHYLELTTGIVDITDCRITEEMKAAEQTKARNLEDFINRNGGCPSIVLKTRN